MKLGDTCNIVGGGTPSKGNSAFYVGAIPWATVRDMKSETITTTEFKITQEAVATSATNIIPKGNVIVATRVGLGKVCLVDQDTAINQDLKGIIPRDLKQLTVRFLFWWLKSVADLIVEAGTGATVQGVKLPFIRSLPIPLPPLPEQQRIVAILDEAFEGLATAAANAEKNLKNARELFDSYRSAILATKSEQNTECLLGEIAEFKNGLNFTKSSKGEVIKIVGVRDFQQNFWLPIDQLETVQIDGTLSDAYVLKNDDILIVRSNGNKQLIGRCILAANVPDRVSHSGFTIRARISSRNVLPSYLTHFLKSERVRKTLIDSGDGANISSLNQQALSGLQVTYPPIAAQIDVVAKIDAIETEASQLKLNYEQRVTSLSELRQSILNKAFSGELTSQSSPATLEAVA